MNPVELVLGYQGRPAVVFAGLSVNGTLLYRFQADLASQHFAGAGGSIVRNVRRQALRILRDSTWDGIEKLGLHCAFDGMRHASREVHVYPRMSEQDRQDLVAALCTWMSQWIAAGGPPIGQATPLYRVQGRVVGGA